MQNNYYLRSNTITTKGVLLFSLVILGSCKVSAPIQMPAPVNLPLSFLETKQQVRTDTLLSDGLLIDTLKGERAISEAVSADSSNIGYIPKNDFFADTYLVRLIEIGLQNNFDRLQALQRIEIARAQVQTRRGALLPTVNVIAQAGVDKFGDYTMNGVGNYDTNLSDNLSGNQQIPNPTPDYFLGVRSSWEIDIWGKLANQRKGAYMRLLASERGKQFIETALVAQVAGLYYELLTLDYELEIIRQNIALQQTAVELVEVQKSAGRVTQLAVQQFKAQLLNTKSLQAGVGQEIIVAENRLNALLGRFPQQVQRGKPILEQILPSTIQAGVPSAMLHRRPDILQAELELAATRADVDAARASFFPSLTISTYVGLNAFNASLLFNPASLAYGILGGLSTPFLNRRQLAAAYNYSAARTMEAYYNYQQTIIRGFSEVVTSLQGIENYGKALTFKGSQVEELRQAASTANDLFVAGYATYLEVVTAQRNVLEAELELADVKKEQFLSLIDLYRALGGGWE